MNRKWKIFLLMKFVFDFVDTSDVAKQPHIILIVADDIGYNDVPWHNPVVLAPAMDTLARNGIILEQSYVLPACTPSRSALFTGRYPFTLGRQHGVIKPLIPTGLDLNAKIIPQSLKKLGYDTHAIGKWHLGFCKASYTPQKRGFDSFFGFYTGSLDYFSHRRSRKGNKKYHLRPTYRLQGGFDFNRNGKPFKEATGIYSTYLFADEADTILRNRNASVPLFLYVGFQSVHAPLQVPTKYSKLYDGIKHQDRKTYLGMISAMDDAIGQIITSLQETDHYKNSVIIFTTDNGGASGKAAGSNWPLRGHKGTLWEGGTRGAAFIHSPLLPKLAGTVHNQLIHVTDWYPTFVHLAGGSPPPGLDGINAWGALQGTEPPREEVVYNIDNFKRFKAAIRLGDFKLIVGNPGDETRRFPEEGIVGHWQNPSLAPQNASQLNRPNSPPFFEDNDDYESELHDEFEQLELHHVIRTRYPSLMFRPRYAHVQNALLPSGDVQNALLPSGDVQNALLPSGDVQNGLLPSGDVQNALLPSGDFSGNSSRQRQPRHFKSEQLNWISKKKGESFLRRNGLHLFNLKVDPLETDDLSDSMTDTTQMLLQRLLDHLPRVELPDIHQPQKKGQPKLRGDVYTDGWC